MRIQEAEIAVGISRKNIRFYEEQGLIEPARDSNRYRDYQQEDIDRLKTIKVLRQLSVPIGEIRRLFQQQILLEDCLRRHLIYLEGQQRNLANIQNVCRQMIEQQPKADILNLQQWTEQILQMEKEGVRFMSVANDRRRRMIAPVVCALVIIFLMVVLMGSMLWIHAAEPMPIMLLIVLLMLPAAVAMGVGIALAQRIQEIRKGEADEIIQY